MIRFAIAAAILSAATFSSAGLASADGLVVGAGPAGVYVDVGHPYRRHHWRRHYERCRVIVRHRINRFGERVTVRRRICER